MTRYFKTNYTSFVLRDCNVIYKLTDEGIVFKYEPNGWYKTMGITPDDMTELQELSKEEVMLELL